MHWDRSWNAPIRSRNWRTFSSSARNSSARFFRDAERHPAIARKLILELHDVIDHVNQSVGARNIPDGKHADVVVFTVDHEVHAVMVGDFEFSAFHRRDFH